MNSDLKIIKKKYGEDMMKLVRKLFPTLLEEEGLVSRIILNNFYPYHDLYTSIVSNGMEELFKEYIYNQVKKDKAKEKTETMKTPKELFSLAGYELYECNSNREIEFFEKYYAKGEELCTFSDKERLSKCYVFFAVKKNIDEIKRENFISPKREDEYGTSILSIQFDRNSSHNLSIKNRYNSKVENPDATFSNNLENIQKGLTRSFEREYGLIEANNKVEFKLPNYFKACDGRYYKYNYEINNIYYCANNIIIDGYKIHNFDHERYIVLDYFILDLQNKKIMLYDNTITDSFIDGFENIEKIDVLNTNAGKKITLKADASDIIILLDKDNKIVEYENRNIKKVGSSFLSENDSLLKLDLGNAQRIGMLFLYENKCLAEINIEKAKEIDMIFLYRNKWLTEIYLPNLIRVGTSFLHDNKILENIYAPNLQKIGREFLFLNNNIREISLSNLERDYYRYLNLYVRTLLLKEESDKKIKKLRYMIG